jgi:hypothetical protein
MLEWLIAGVALFCAVAIFLFLEMWLPVKRPPPRVTSRLDRAAAERSRRRSA